MPLVTFDYQSQPRAALGYSFVCQLAVLQAMGVLRDVGAGLEEAITLLVERGKDLGPDVPLQQNVAKQLATSLYGRVPVIVGTGPLSPAARRWKTQLNENSKAWAYFEDLPEMNHNALSGIHFPAEAAHWFRVLFLRGTELHQRIELRLDLTQEILGGRGIACQQLRVPGESALAQMLAAVQLGDYTSCYLAFLNGTDPTDISDITGLKQSMTAR
ncbi:SIS domain-containing protein [Chloroflexota bacterium]